ncbi:interferon-inducible GTPase 5-like protein [Labeo rohita]|uniref:Interferon-inducible GTPase 5-like protein n=2 Tax=Labeonini TaxID=2743697 RepID=A0A498M7R1_LABRO|nr:interferon-inducible GTPase 5-like protein [Labeo rohita]
MNINIRDHEEHELEKYFKAQENCIDQIYYRLSDKQRHDTMVCEMWAKCQEKLTEQNHHIQFLEDEIYKAREELREDIGESPYSLYLDETTDISVNKLLCICVKYRSVKHRKFVSTHLGLVELLDCNANGISDAVVAFLREYGLDIKNLVGIATDGASVMVFHYSSWNQEIQFAIQNMENQDPAVVDAIKASGESTLEKATAKAKMKMDQFFNVSLNIAVTGVTGSGKSSFVNVLRGLKDDDVGAAPTGVTETTMEPVMYEHPEMPNVKIWDLPGIGSSNLKSEKYLKDVKFNTYDFFIILSSVRFMENDIMLAKEIRKQKKDFYFVRSKIDNDISSEKEKKGFDEQKVLSIIRDDCQKNLKELGDPKVFLISSRNLQKYDFESLQNILEDELPEHKKYALLQAWPVCSAASLEKKINMFKRIIWAVSLASACIAVVPVPGLSAACDLGILVNFLTRLLTPGDNPVLTERPSSPADARTLLRTSRSESVVVQEKAGGTYHYFGILKSMQTTLEAYKCSLANGVCLELQANVDGLPIFKSSSTQFWPILGVIKNLPQHEPFVIGLFCGTSKPACLLEYLEDFVAEVVELEKGFSFQGITMRLQLCSMVCDAPARAFLKNVKGHTGYSGCEKCMQEGEYVNNRVVFPQTDARLRTDKDFKEMADEGHHLGSSPLVDTSLGMVSGFPLDYMHLVCLGVMRRLLYLWLKGPLASRLSGSQVNILSEMLLKIRKNVPVEFARRPRSLNEVGRWKAAEFRQFLLYTGPVLLKDVLHTAVYQHFLLMFVGVFILSNKALLEEYTDYANDALVLFVQHFGKLYGDMYLSYNVHNLVHLAQDVKVHGNLDSFSAFKFENFMQKLKRLVRKPESPCCQVVKRLAERESVQMHRVESLGVRREHTSGPLPPLFQCAQQYTQYNTELFTLKLDEANSHVYIQGKVAKIRNIIEKEEVIMYLIVLFKEENKTGPVAKEWFSDGLAWWPPYKDKCQILQSVQKKAVPNPSKGWRQFAARVLYESVISQAPPESSNRDHCPVPAWQPRNKDCSQLISQARPVSSNSDHCPVPAWQPSNINSSQRITSNLRQELEVRPETDRHQRPAYTEPVERIILEQLGELHIKVDHLAAIVQSLCQNRAQDQQPQSNDYDHLLPISTLHELNSFDEKLCRDGDFKKHVIAKLSIIGGNSVKKNRVAGMQEGLYT